MPAMAKSRPVSRAIRAVGRSTRRTIAARNQATQPTVLVSTTALATP
jgi:hypothetical protein